MGKEILRYNRNGLEYIGTVEEFEDFKRPKGYEDKNSLWFSIFISSTTCKKHIGPISRDTQVVDKRLESGNVDTREGLEIYYDILKYVRSWIDRNKPIFITFSAYSDVNWYKRYRIYDRALRKMGYEIWEPNYQYEELVLTYIRNDVDVKRKNYKIENVLEGYNAPWLHGTEEKWAEIITDEFS